MSIELALGLLAAAFPLTALVIRISGMITPVQFVKLETEFTAFREEVRREFDYLKQSLEKKADEE